MFITVDIRTVYGVRAVYPFDQKAGWFAQIAGTTTLTPATVKAIKALGYEVRVKQPQEMTL